MKRLGLFLLAVVLVAGMAGCSTTGRKIAENLTSLPPTKGLVLFSTGASKTSAAFSTNLLLFEGSSRKRYNKVVINIDYPFHSHFANEHGHVRTLLLPAGDYYLLPEIANPYVWRTDPYNPTRHDPVYKFTVQSNRVAYIGNFWSSGHHLSWSDLKLSRDKSYFLQKNPGMVSIPIEPQKPEVVSDVLSFGGKGIIWSLP